MKKTVYTNRPNWLGSEVALVTKPFTLKKSFDTGLETVNGRKIVKSGTIITTPYKGLLFGDVDITDGDQIASVMIGGRYIDSKLPVSASANATEFASQGLFAIEEGSVTRPY